MRGIFTIELLLTLGLSIRKYRLLTPPFLSKETLVTNHQQKWLVNGSQGCVLCKASKCHYVHLTLNNDAERYTKTAVFVKAYQNNQRYRSYNQFRAKKVTRWEVRSMKWKVCEKRSQHRNGPVHHGRRSFNANSITFWISLLFHFSTSFFDHSRRHGVREREESGEVLLMLGERYASHGVYYCGKECEKNRCVASFQVSRQHFLTKELNRLGDSLYVLGWLVCKFQGKCHILDHVVCGWVKTRCPCHDRFSTFFGVPFDPTPSTNTFIRGGLHSI